MAVVNAFPPSWDQSWPSLNISAMPIVHGRNFNAHTQLQNTSLNYRCYCRLLFGILASPYRILLLSLRASSFESTPSLDNGRPAICFSICFCRWWFLVIYFCPSYSSSDVRIVFVFAFGRSAIVVCLPAVSVARRDVIVRLIAGGTIDWLGRRAATGTTKREAERKTALRANAFAKNDLWQKKCSKMPIVCRCLNVKGEWRLCVCVCVRWYFSSVCLIFITFCVCWANQ